MIPMLKTSACHCLNPGWPKANWVWLITCLPTKMSFIPKSLWSRLEWPQFWSTVMHIQWWRWSSVNPIPTKGGRLCPPCYWLLPLRIWKPNDISESVIYSIQPTEFKFLQKKWSHKTLFYYLTYSALTAVTWVSWVKNNQNLVFRVDFLCQISYFFPKN